MTVRCEILSMSDNLRQVVEYATKDKEQNKNNTCKNVFTKYISLKILLLEC